MSADEVTDSLGLNVSETLIGRRLNEGGLRSRSAAQKPELAKIQQREHFEFSINYGDWGAEEWSKVVFTDVSTFTTRWD